MAEAWAFWNDRGLHVWPIILLCLPKVQFAAVSWHKRLCSSRLCFRNPIAATHFLHSGRRKGFTLSRLTPFLIESLGDRLVAMGGAEAPHALKHYL